MNMLCLVCLCRLSAALDELLPEAFATVREASRRVLGMRHFDSQLVGEFGSSSDWMESVAQQQQHRSAALYMWQGCCCKLCHATLSTASASCRAPEARLLRAHVQQAGAAVCCALLLWICSICLSHLACAMVGKGSYCLPHKSAGC